LFLTLNGNAEGVAQFEKGISGIGDGTRGKAGEVTDAAGEQSKKRLIAQGGETMATDLDERRQTTNGRDRGRQATRPGEVGARGWLDALKRTRRGIRDTHASIVAAGVAFYAFLALVPALIALVIVYGLVASPADIKDQIASFASAAPRDAQRLLTSQLTSITRGGAGGGATIGAVIAITGAIWAASSGMAALDTGLTIVNRETETRGFLKRRLLALTLTVFAVIGVLLMLALVVALPSVLDSMGVGDIGKTAIGLARWVLLAALLLFGLGVIFRYGPQRRRPRWRWITPGAIVAVIVGLAASIGFSIYVTLMGNYNKTYGSLGAIIVLLLWLYFMAYAVLFGAAMNAELERQTERDTTAGDERPMGERGAYAADTVGPTRQEL
jgi:membrane protein